MVTERERPNNMGNSVLKGGVWEVVGNVSFLTLVLLIWSIW